ncbi:MAG: hypothetical protein L0Z53_15570, partial [Acidobacteriales bacterium]|nr:hypothetical protein [Terriglobales bacterium]
AKYPFVSPEGGKEPLRAMLTPFTSGSDHQVYMDSSWRIPAVYLNDWPDRYIHTNADSPAMIDPTKLKRAAFIGAATGYYLGQLSSADVVHKSHEETWGETLAKALEVLIVIVKGQLRRGSTLLDYLSEDDETLGGAYVAYESGVLRSINDFVPGFIQEPEVLESIVLYERLQDSLSDPEPGSGPVFERDPETKGPMSVFGYDYFDDKYGAENARKLGLLSYRGVRGSGGDYAYEVLNFVDGQRTAQEIRDAVSAEFGPVPLELVVEYLRALEKIAVVKVKE